MASQSWLFDDEWDDSRRSGGVSSGRNHRRSVPTYSYSLLYPLLVAGGASRTKKLPDYPCLNSRRMWSEEPLNWFVLLLLLTPPAENISRSCTSMESRMTLAMWTAPLLTPTTCSRLLPIPKKKSAQLPRSLLRKHHKSSSIHLLHVNIFSWSNKKTINPPTNWKRWISYQPSLILFFLHPLIALTNREAIGEKKEDTSLPVSDTQ